MAKALGAEAFQMFLPASLSAHPETGFAPESVGCAPVAACQMTWWPLAPESAAAKINGAVNA